MKTRHTLPSSLRLGRLRPRRLRQVASRPALAAGVTSALALAIAALHPVHAAHEDAVQAAASAAAVDPFAHAFAELGPPLPAATDVPAGAVDLAALPGPPAAEPVITQSLGTGVASFYGNRFHGRPTASGERFDMHALTAAHRTLPFGTLVEVTNPANGRTVIVRINDRGPFHHKRTIDVSRAAAEQLGLIGRGHGTVELAVLKS
ncbi:MAG: septal ring lytic transglycosylase RlpA family protein [Erythrobacter sp.]|jgi:rare lipoprotein A|nr:septal ring lytic transglycosylase RlpA family protein [Erythrobacter sp.]